MAEDTQTVQQLRAKVREARRAFERSLDGAFVREMRGAMNEFTKMRHEGVSFDDGIRGVESVLRDVWPWRPTRFQVCGACDGTGYRETFCTHALRCNRYKCGIADTSWEHAYVVPCECELGDRLKARFAAVNSEDQLAAVGRRKKPKPTGWSRV